MIVFATEVEIELDGADDRRLPLLAAADDVSIVTVEGAVRGDPFLFLLII